MAGWTDRVKASFNILLNRVPDSTYVNLQSSRNIQERSIRDTTSAILAPIKTRIAMDAAMVSIRHVRLDENDSYLDDMDSELNARLTRQANIDQSGFAFIQDVAMTMLEYGVVAIVPTDVTTDPKVSTTYDPLSLRTGIVTDWYNRHVEVSVYNDNTGEREEITLPKSFVALAYNPLYSVMNEVNSTLTRLVETLAISDISSRKMKSPNLDLILQLPFAIKNTKRASEAERRITLLEEQLFKSPYGVAYIDATEKITQLNRPVENTLANQVQYLTENLHSQLGLTPLVFSGAASPEEMISYYNRTVGPILKSITSSIKMTFLTRTAIKQKQSIMAFSDLFKMAPIAVLAEAVDKFTRNEIMSSNEVRSRLGLKPRTDDPGANELRNKNLNRDAGKNEAANE